MGVLTTIRFQVTAMMSPSARMIVYYILDDGEIVADSTLLDVDDVFPNDVDRKSTRLNSSHANISYAFFCLKKKTI